MAKFETHLSLGAASGVLLAAAGLHANQIHSAEGVAVVALAAISGCLPDIDQKDSKPYQFLSHFLCFVLPLVLLMHLKPTIGKELWINVVFYILFCTISYFVILPLISKMTKHRGVMHTLPFAVLCSELTYLLFISDYEWIKSASPKMPVYFATAVFVGYFSHLLADELWALYDQKKKKFKVKKSFGSALTMYSAISTPRANFTVYLLATLAAFAINSRQVSLQSLLQMFINSH